MADFEFKILRPKLAAEISRPNFCLNFAIKLAIQFACYFTAS